MKRIISKSKLFKLFASLFIIVAVAFNLIVSTDVLNTRVHAQEKVYCSLEELEGDVPSINGQIDFDLSQVEAYSGKEYAVVNDNKPFFLEDDLTTQSYEYYGPLDRLGRCTQAYACIGKEMLPKDPRENIGSVRPTGYHSVVYSSIEGSYLYNR